MPVFLNQYISGAYTGYTGSQGAQGTQGAQGVQGIQGVDGAFAGQGIQGAQGFEGQQGVQGIQGAQGIPGEFAGQGIQGVQGFEGQQGVQGIQGIDGQFAGQGIQGIQGAVGTQGIQGIQGISFVTSNLTAAATLDGTELVRVEQGGNSRRSTAQDIAARFGKSDATITAGYTTIASDDGTLVSGTYVPSPSGGNMRKIINNGSFTFSAPIAAGDFSMIIQITNGATAGTITWSGFSKTPDGDALTTTNTHRFNVYITKIAGTVIATVKSIQ